MKILAINAGSSSLKFQLLEMPSEDVLTEGVVERIGFEDAIFGAKANGEKVKNILAINDHSVAVKMLLNFLVDKKIVASLDEISGVGHRVVHGGEEFKDSALVTDDVIRKIEELSDLAPLHNPANLVGIKAFQEALPNVPAVVVFDTAFHQTMKPDAYMYATPYEWYEKHAVRKYGFHGTSHKYVAERVAEITGNKNVKVINCHIGNGASICAIDGGKSVETSMGFTPLAGIPMGTRSGDIDPAIIEFISVKEGKTVKEVVNTLNKQSGYLGVSGISSDARDVRDAQENGHERANMTIELQTKRIADYIAAYYLYMGGCDVITFTAGVGENYINLRARVLNRLACLGVKLDAEANNCGSKEQLITAADSKIKAYIIPTNEEVVIARDTVRLGKIN